MCAPCLNLLFMRNMQMQEGIKGLVYAILRYHAMSAKSRAELDDKPTAEADVP